MKEYNYFWNKADKSEEELVTARRCIEEHDFEGFLKERQKLNAGGANCLPDEISVYDDETDGIEYISALDPENFSLIEFNRCRG